MAGNMNRGSGGLVHHWKHGWIPLTPHAALQKAHGSKSGAAKLMGKHGIGDGKSDVAKSHPIGAKVEAKQPGIDNVTHGRVVGHTDSGMVQVAHTGHGGKPLVGTFNPAHTQVVKADAPAAKAPHPAPHTLKPGEHATVTGIDHMGQPMTLTGKVMANGEVSAFGKNRTTGGQPLRSIAIERQDNSKRQNVVYVPDPNRGEQKRGAAATNAAAPAKVRALPAGDTFKGVHSETHMGERITVRKGKQWGTIETQINGHTVGISHGTRNADAVKHLDSARGTVDHAKANPGSYTNGNGDASYGMKLNAKQTAPAPSPHATRAEQLRAAAAKKRAEADRIANGAGVNDRAAAMLSGKTHSRQVAKDDAALRRFSEKQREAKALESKAHLAEGRAKSAADKQRAADLSLKPSDVTPGDMVMHNGELRIVTKVNKTTVNVPSGYSWDDKVPLAKVTRHVPLSTQSDSAIRTAFDRTKDVKVKSVLRAELLRRGLSA